MKSIPQAAVTEETAVHVLREQVAMLYATSLSSTIAGTLLAMAMATAFYWRLGDAWALVWLGLNVALILRRPLYAAYYKDPQAEQRSDYWAKRHWQLIFIYSAVWGLAPWMFMPHDDLAMTSLMMLITLGLASGGVPAVGARWPSLLAFVLPMVLSLIAALLWRKSSMHLVLAGLAAVHLAATLDFSRQQYRLLITALVARFEKTALAEQLAGQIAVTQKLSEEKTRFFASASHDLRQPLHAIALFGAVLEKDLQGHAHHTNAIRLMRAVNALGTSLDTMLDVSRLDAGVIRPEVQPVALNAVFQTVNQVFASFAEEKHLQLRLRASPLWVQTDPLLLQRLLSNLVDNAIKYTTHGGVLVLARARGKQVWIDVIDSGVGIAPEQRELVFHEFYQIGNPGRDRAQGLGIGLSIVRRLSTLLEHPLQVHSIVGRGSRFRVILPAATPSALGVTDAQRQAPRILATTAAAPLALPARVLLIEDESDIADAMVALLQSHRVALLVAQNEAQSIATLERHVNGESPIDVLVCDYRLANGADGLDLALKLRATYAPQLPLLLVTGESSPDRLQKVHDLGLPVLFKPVSGDALLAALAAAHKVSQSAGKRAN